MFSDLSAVQCERKPLALTSGSTEVIFKNKTIGLDYHTSSEDSDDDKRSETMSKTFLEDNNESHISEIFKDTNSKEEYNSANFSSSLDHRVHIVTDPELNEHRPINGFNTHEQEYFLDSNRVSSVDNQQRYLLHQTLADSPIERKPVTLLSPPNRKLYHQNDVKYFTSQKSNDSNDEIDVESCSSTKERESKSSTEVSILKGSKILRLEAPTISTADVGYLYEISTRLLFGTLDWIRGLNCFDELSNIDKLNLMLNRWYSLFALGIAQYSSMFPISTMLFLANSSNDHSQETCGRTSNAPPLRWNTFVKLKDVVMNGNLNITSSKEIYDYMKIITLFDQG